VPVPNPNLTSAEVAGRNPLNTFLTGIGRTDAVEPVGQRSGLYRLSVKERATASGAGISATPAAAPVSAT
jgi:hypothetical protein